MVKYLGENQDVLDTLRVCRKSSILFHIQASMDIFRPSSSNFMQLVKWQSTSCLEQAEQLHLAEKISPGPSLTLEDLAEMPYASKVNTNEIFLINLIEISGINR